MSTGAGGGMGGSFNFNTSFTDINEGIFGKDTQRVESGTIADAGTTKERFELNTEGVLALVEDVLTSEQGLASIFSGEKATGLYDTSVARQEAGDLIGQIAGELAKLTGTKVTEVDKKSTKGVTTANEQEGLFDQVFGGGIF